MKTGDKSWCQHEPIDCSCSIRSHIRVEFRIMQYKVANSPVRNGTLYQMRCWTPQEKSSCPPPYSKSESVNLRNVDPHGALPASLKNSGTEPAPKTGAALGA